MRLFDGIASTQARGLCADALLCITMNRIMIGNYERLGVRKRERDRKKPEQENR